MGLKGVTVASQTDGLSLDAKDFEPFVARASELGATVFFVYPALRRQRCDLMRDYTLSVILTREFDLARHSENCAHVNA
jgi:hypothetical protein